MRYNYAVDDAVLDVAVAVVATSNTVAAAVASSQSFLYIDLLRWWVRAEAARFEATNGSSPAQTKRWIGNITTFR